MKKLNLVIDTNVFLVILSRKSKFNWIFDAILKNKINLLVSTAILLEYYEKISEITQVSIAEDVLKLILSKPSILKINISYKWGLITADPDDNAFVDCAVSGNADYIVTDDGHFDILKTIEFPSVSIISLNEFHNQFFDKIQSL